MREAFLAVNVNHQIRISMIGHILKKIFGSRNERILRAFRKEVKKINALEPEYEALSDEALRAKTASFKARLEQGEILDALLVEAFAAVREAAKRTLGLRHFDVQLLGGMVLHSGKIAEMRTGEGKTLTSTLPAYLNALVGKGVHIVTVNDYLAKRDAEWMRPVYEQLGMTIGVNLTTSSPEEKKAAYEADITAGTNNEFGFDYLRDNMVYDLSERVQRDLHYAIVDEVDSILIDEARTPLIISGQAEASSDLYAKINALIPQLERQVMREGQKEEEVPLEDQRDFIVDEKNRQVHLTERGHERVETMLTEAGLLKEGDSLYDYKNISLMHYVNAALRAHALYTRDVHYVVKNNEVIIVDEHTGRLMDGRRWSEGLHQAMEAKEGVEVQLENQTLATITFQNYFRMYDKLSGMTGTADTEAFEFQKIYGLEVVVVPTNKPMIRKDLADKIFLTEKEKFKAILEEIKECKKRAQPVLVGTASIESSERLSALLKSAKIPHEVLNAKQHEREAKIIEEAGKPGTVTIATNMAGRGTDIVLGGNPESTLNALKESAASEQAIAEAKQAWQAAHDAVLTSGGLHVLCTERNESRRIDNQLRGRSGRQGDPGSSQFYLSMEDNLLRIFAAERMSNFMRKLGIKEGDVIQHPWINKSIENAQKRVEGINFDIRKQLLEYDDVANDQRKVIYAQRHELLCADAIEKTVTELREEAIEHLVSQYVPEESLEEQWDIEGLEQRIHEDFEVTCGLPALVEETSIQAEAIPAFITEKIAKAYAEKEAQTDSETLRTVEKNVMLQMLDSHWKDHLAAMDHLRQSIHLRGYAQKNPAQEYKRECFDMFKNMIENLKYEFVSTLSHLKVMSPEEMAMQQPLQPPQLNFHHAEMASQTSDHPGALMEDDEDAAARPFVRQGAKVGRNDPCPCGSQKKYKHCHGQLS